MVAACGTVASAIHRDTAADVLAMVAIGAKLKFSGAAAGHDGPAVFDLVGTMQRLSVRSGGLDDIRERLGNRHRSLPGCKDAVGAVALRPPLVLDGDGAIDGRHFA